MTTTTSGKYNDDHSVRITNEDIRLIDSAKQQLDEKGQTSNKDLLVAAMEINSALYLLSKYPDDFEVVCRVENFMGEPRPEYYLKQIRKSIRTGLNCYNHYWIVYSEKHYIFTNLILADSDNGIIKVKSVLNILAHNDSYIIKTCAEHVMNETFTSFYITRSGSYDSKRDLDVYRTDLEEKTYGHQN